MNILVKFILLLFTTLILNKIVNSQTDSSFAADNFLNVNPDSLSSEDSVYIKDSVKFFSLTIKTNIENAEVYSDSTLLGRTPLDTFKLKEGKYNLKFINPVSLKEWQNYIKLLEMDMVRDTIINVEFSYYYFIETNPFNAKVYNNDSLIGETPLRFFTKNKLTGFLNFNKKNYKVYAFELKDYNFQTGLNLELVPKGKEPVNDLVYKDRSTQFKTKRQLLPVFGTALATVASGIFAINYKNNANNEYDNYLRTGNTSYLNEANNNDTYFTISIILMQAALGGLIYFLFFD